MKHSFFQAAIVSILLYGCTTWTLTRRLKKKLDGNYTRLLRVMLNKSWRQHPTRYQLYGHLLPIMKSIQVRRTRYAGHCWRSKDELISDVLLLTPHMAKQEQDDQLEHTYSSYVRIWGVALKTCQRRWIIGRSGERGSGISVLAARHDDDDDIYIYIYIRIGWIKKRSKIIKKIKSIYYYWAHPNVNTYTFNVPTSPSPFLYLTLINICLLICYFFCI